MLPQAAQQSECVVHGMVPPLLIGTAVVCLPPKVEAVEVEVILKVKLIHARVQLWIRSDALHEFELRAPIYVNFEDDEVFRLRHRA